MLSIVDLIEAGTMSRELAAYCLAAIGNGASFLVGALPGGAGKTTVMGALLNFVPRDVQLVPADGMAAILRGVKAGEPRCCYICHEIGGGPYYAYLWGEELRAYFDLPEAGHLLATNLHADTYRQAYDQICGDNGVSGPALQRMNLMLFLSVRRRALRVVREIAAVWESDGAGHHRPVYQSGTEVIEPTALVSASRLGEARQTIDDLIASRARTIEDVRTFLLHDDERVS